VSLIAIGVWLGGVALNIRRTFVSLVDEPSSYDPCLLLERLDNGEEAYRVFK
jgi:hypothetical protein